jgi:hypothetical protein
MSNLIHTDEITDSDLRRTFILFSIGFALVLLDLYFLAIDFVSGSAADPTTTDPESTPSWITNGLLITSVPIMVFSQLWYLRTKHVLDEIENSLRDGRYWGIIKNTSLETLILLATVIAPVSFMLSEASPVFIVPFLGIYFLLIILEISSFLYFPIILSWNFKRSIDKRHPGMDGYLRSSLSLLLGLISAVVFVFALVFAVIVVSTAFNAVEHRLSITLITGTIPRWMYECVK